MNPWLSALLGSLATLAICGGIAWHGAADRDGFAALHMLRDTGLLSAMENAGTAKERWQTAPTSERRFQEWMAWLYEAAFQKRLFPPMFNGHMHDVAPECRDKRLRAALPEHLRKQLQCGRSLGRVAQENFLTEQIDRLRVVHKLPCLHGHGPNLTSCSCVEWDGRYLPWLVRAGVCDKKTSYVLEYATPERQRVRPSKRRILGDLQKGDTFIPSTLKFDIVWCTSVFEHLPYPHVAMKQMARITKPGGFISWSAPFFAKHHSDPYDFWRLSHDALYLLSLSSHHCTRYSTTAGHMNYQSETVCDPLRLEIRDSTHRDSTVPGRLAPGGGGGSWRRRRLHDAMGRRCGRHPQNHVFTIFFGCSSSCQDV